MLRSMKAGPEPVPADVRRCAARALAVLCAIAMLTACGGDRSETPTASSEMGRPAESIGAGSEASASGSGEDDSALLARGEILSFACRPCHGLAPGDESPVGPHLNGIFGRPAASLPGFEYSSALRESGIVWTAEALDAWLAQPETFLPGNDMDFAGFRSAEDRRALIAYLRKRTALDEAAQSGPVTVEGASD